MATVTQKGQVTIPKEIREKIGIFPGTQVKFEIEGDKCILKKKIEGSVFDRWVGYLKSKKSTDKIIEELRGKAE